MRCPECGAATRVLETRYSQLQKRRRRVCTNAACGKRFPTVERIITPEHDLPLVIKNDGRSEAFDGQKLRKSLRLALAKRPFDSRAVAAIEQEICAWILKKSVLEICSQEIGRFVMRALQQVDSVAYIRFASVYRNFKDAGAFQDEAMRIAAAHDGDKDQQAFPEQLDLFGIGTDTSSRS